MKYWNRKRYDQWIEDGYHWSLHFTYDNTVIVSNGLNGYPQDFALFLDILHKNYKLPKARLEPDEKNLIRDIRDTVITEDDNIDRFAMYFI